MQEKGWFTENEDHTAMADRIGKISVPIDTFKEEEWV